MILGIFWGKYNPNLLNRKQSTGKTTVCSECGIWGGGKKITFEDKVKNEFKLQRKGDESQIKQYEEKKERERLGEEVEW